MSIDNMQFGYISGKGTTDAILIMRQVQEKPQAKKKKLYYACVALEKAFDRVPRSSRPGYVVKGRTDPGYVVKQCPRIVMNKIFDWH